MTVIVNKSTANGEIYAPPSKSYAHRMMICSALSDGKSIIKGISDSEDMKATLDCIKALGATYKIDGGVCEITGNHPCIGNGKVTHKFMCRESGSTLRFIIPIALVYYAESEFYGTEKLISRGISVYEQICTEQGIICEKHDSYIRLCGKLHGGVFNVRGDISSQFISGLMFALPLCKEDSVINITTAFESYGYALITADVLKKFGICVEVTEKTVKIKGNQTYKCGNFMVEGDMSNGAFLDAFNVIGGDVSVKGLDFDTYQPDKTYRKYFDVLKNGTPTLDVSSCPDLAPVLMALMAVKNGGRLIGTRRLKIKESDRGAAMAYELCKIGSFCDVLENEIVIRKTEKYPTSVVFDSHNDHRIVMALSVISTLFGARITGAETVKKSYPEFFGDISKLGIGTEYEIR